MLSHLTALVQRPRQPLDGNGASPLRRKHRAALFTGRNKNSGYKLSGSIPQSLTNRGIKPVGQAQLFGNCINPSVHSRPVTFLAPLPDRTRTIARSGGTMGYAIEPGWDSHENWTSKDGSEERHVSVAGKSPAFSHQFLVHSPSQGFPTVDRHLVWVWRQGKSLDGFDF